MYSIVDLLYRRQLFDLRACWWFSSRGIYSCTNFHAQIHLL